MQVIEGCAGQVDVGIHALGKGEMTGSTPVASSNVVTVPSVGKP